VTGFDVALKRLEKHIWYMAHKFKVSIHGQEADDLFQEGVIKLYEIYTSARYKDKTGVVLDAIFRTSLYNMFRDMYRESRAEIAVIDVEVDVEKVTEVRGYDAFLDLYSDHCRDAFVEGLSSDAVNMLELLLNPTPAVYHLHNIQRMRREHLRSQGMTVRIPQKITHKLVGQVLGFTPSKTKRVMKELQLAWDSRYRTSK